MLADADRATAGGGHRRLAMRMLGAATLAACGWGAVRLTGPPAARSRRLAAWYWHHPFRLDAAEMERLRRAGIERLYVHAGTLGLREGHFVIESRQRWATHPPVETYAVVRVHPDALPALLAPGGASRALAAAEPLLRETTGGLQWDADVPTARLPEYARFLRESRKRLPPRLPQSVTALPDWLRSEAYCDLCRAAEEVVPQFYGNRWPGPGEAPPLWETSALLDGARRSAPGPARVWIGLPAYGRCLVFDPGGYPAGVRHDLDPEALLAEPGWQVATSRTRAEALRRGGGLVPVEDTLAFRASSDAPAGGLELPPGATLWFQWPRADGFRAARSAIAELRLRHVEGVCLFRWPEPGEPLAFAGNSILAAASGGAGRSTGSGTSLQVRGVTRGGDLVLRVFNAGPAAPRLDNGIRLEVRPAGGEVLSEAPVTWRHGAQPASRLRADRAGVARPFLMPGQTWDACTVRRPRGPVHALLRWQDPDGRERGQTWSSTRVTSSAALTFNGQAGGQW